MLSFILVYKLLVKPNEPYVKKRGKMRVRVQIVMDLTILEDVLELVLFFIFNN